MKKLLLTLLSLAATAFGQPTVPINNARLGGVNKVISGGSLAPDGTGTITATAFASSSLLSTALDLIGSTRGGILYRGSTGWTVLTPGTATYVLTSNGTGADPTWQIVNGLPSQTGNNGKFLTTNGTIASWGTIPVGGDVLAANNLSEFTATAATARGNIGAGTGNGTVTSVGVTTANGVSASGGPITGSGNFTFTLGAITPTTVFGTGTTDATDATGTTGSLGTLGGLSVAKKGYFGTDVSVPLYNVGDAGFINEGSKIYIPAGTVGSPSTTRFTVPPPASGEDTLITLFGSTTLMGGASSSVSDIVGLHDGSTWRQYWYDSVDHNHWRVVGLGSTDQNNVVVPNTVNSVYILRKTTDLTITFPNRGTSLDIAIQGYRNIFLRPAYGGVFSIFETVVFGTPKTPASAADTGTAGTVCWDVNYVYVCIAKDTWRRAALGVW